MRAKVTGLILITSQMAMEYQKTPPVLILGLSFEPRLPKLNLYSKGKKYTVSINSVIHRQTVAQMDSFLWPGAQADSQDTHRAPATIHVAARAKDYRTGSAVLPTTTQTAYSMWKACTHTKVGVHGA